MNNTKQHIRRILTESRKELLVDAIQTMVSNPMASVVLFASVQSLVVVDLLLGKVQQVHTAVVDEIASTQTHRCKMDSIINRKVLY